jgi:uncharacterized protein DUF2752
MNARRNANLAALGAIVAAALLYCFPPGKYSFYPACPVYRYLHLYCPGCGSTRALAALLHGHLSEAINYNPLFVAVLPSLIVWAGIVYGRAVVTDELRWPQVPKPAVMLFLGFVAVFTIVRNS